MQDGITLRVTLTPKLCGCSLDNICEIYFVIHLLLTIIWHDSISHFDYHDMNQDSEIREITCFDMSQIYFA